MFIKNRNKYLLRISFFIFLFFSILQSAYGKQVCEEIKKWECNPVGSPPRMECGWVKEQLCHEEVETGSPQKAACEVVSIYNLGYERRGNKHDFCMAKNYTGGHINSYCFRGNCPQIKAFYQCISTGGNRCCDHLSQADACKLHVCSCK